MCQSLKPKTFFTVDNLLGSGGDGAEALDWDQGAGDTSVAGDGDSFNDGANALLDLEFEHMPLDVQLHVDSADSKTIERKDDEMEVEGEDSNFHFDPKDPASFISLKTFTPSITDKILLAGANQPSAADLKKKEFPRNREGKTFNPTWYFTKDIEGSPCRRTWLSYSESEDKVYCLDCILFGKPANKTKHPAFSKTGSRLWRNHVFIEHETSAAHVDAAIACDIRRKSLPLNPAMRQAELTQRAQNREIVRHLINVTVYLAQHCLAFRGHHENKFEKLRGNFHDLVDLLAKYSPALDTYLSKVLSSKKKMWNFLSWNRQNQYIKAVSDFILRKVKKDILEAKFFSVSFDESLDTSRKEQCTCIIRYVREDTGTVAERLVAVKASAVTTSDKLFEVLQTIFDELNLDWKTYLVGQAYDGASNMRGAYKGLQQLIRERADSALYVWCWAHRLSLAVKEAADCCLDSAEMFSNLKALYNLINGSKNNVELYENKFRQHYPGKQILRLKRVDTTRWMSHSFALSTVIRAFDAIAETVQEIRETAAGDAKSTANGLLKYLLSEKFVLTSQAWKGIFEVIEPLNASLQGEDVDLMAAGAHVDSVLRSLSAMRSEGFPGILRLSEEFQAASRFEEEFTKLPEIRTRSVKQRYGEKSKDNPISEAQKKFRVETYLYCLDQTIGLISNRFSDRAQGVFKDTSLLTNKRLHEIAKDPASLPKDAFAGFAKVFGTLVNEDDLRREYVQFAKTYPAYENATTLPEYLHKNKDDDSNWVDVEVDVDGEADDPPAQESEWDGYDLEVEHENEDTRPSSDTCTAQKNLQHSGSMSNILRVVHSSALRNIFPMTYTALKIAVTLPVTSASTERSFSKLKIIKNRLRSTMGQDRLESLMIISCEHDIVIDVEEVISILTSYSPWIARNL
ncbi:Zinc finger MYM-type protein 1 [Frankliniella fusca]|uniref:Zinc finger MYM-type protein 1 n=1 Tax=Frankliniella fusca TaxID=407009 RepID=A0AAE1HZC9_9NEOP|nr:Zinc finger MYM-type protein 1 [Frankliniella fusca]